MTSSRSQSDNAADQELLSAYLDEQLTAAERTLLERRLRSDQALQGELQELQSLKLVLQDLPAAVPPRSFTIDPATVRRRGLGWFSWMRLGSVVATMLLLLTFTADFIRGGSTPPAASVLMDQLTAGAAQATAAPAAAASTEAPAAAAAAPAAAPTTVAAAAVPLDPAAAARAAEATSAPAAEAAAPAPAASPEGAGDTAMIAPAAEATSAPAAEAAAPAPAASPEGAGDTAMIAPAASPAEKDSTREAYGFDPGDVAASGSSSPDTQNSELPQPRAGVVVLSPFRWAQLALAVSAVGLAVGAWTLRRRK